MSEEKDYGGYDPSEYHCAYWDNLPKQKGKACDIHSCPLIGDYDELPYALQMPFIQVLDWFIFTIATRCKYHTRN
jgi:hypothetical protein